MNIFWLDWDLPEIPKHYPDRYTYNALREIDEMMQAALVNNGVDVDKIYHNGVSHQNHPATQWVGHSRGTWKTCVKLADAIHNEYRHRYGGIHKSYKTIRKSHEKFKNIFPKDEIPAPPQCFNDYSHYKRKDPVEGYRYYFANIKYPQNWCVWELNRDEPDWINEYTVL